MENKFLDKEQIEALKAVEEARERELQAALDKKNAKKNKRAKVKQEKAAAKKPRSNRPNAFVQILNGDFLTKEFVLNNLNYIFFVIFLLILIVAKGYYGKQLASDVVKTQRELDEITADYFAAKVESFDFKEWESYFEKNSSSDSPLDLTVLSASLTN